MTAITLELIKELRDATGVSITECKKALEETDGNIDAAIDALRAKGIAKAGKRAENATHEGRIAIKHEGGKAFVASLTCETDFVARTDNFSGFIDELMAALISAGSVEAAKEAFTPRMSDIIQQTGENVVFGPMDIIEAPVVGSYVHSNSKVAAVVSANAGTDEEKVRQVAMHVTATNPGALRVSDFPADIYRSRAWCSDGYDETGSKNGRKARKHPRRISSKERWRNLSKKELSSLNHSSSILNKLSNNTSVVMSSSAFKRYSI
jgi:elongation factor Ts